MNGPAIAVENLVFSYRSGAPVLDVPRFELARGRRLFLHGPSGSGKTTLLGVLAGVLPVKSGHVRVLGSDFATLGSHARDAWRGAHIGYIFQMFNLIPYLNVLDNVTLPCQLSTARRERLGGTTPAAAASALLAKLGLAGRETAAVTELSVGQQQRVAAARALIGAPELVIADEPTSALDHDHRQAFIKVLFEAAAQSGASILFVSHDRTLAPLFDEEAALATLNRAARAVAP
jgi:putative ABC transport system ATP-binding protein